jgi:hypothetical protein
MGENKSQKRPRKRPRHPAGGEQKDAASRPEPRFTVMVPTRPDAKPDDKDAWRELGPGEPLPEGVANNFIRVFTPLLHDFLVKFHLAVDDFNDKTWGPFVHAFLGHTSMQAADTERLREIVKGVLERKLKRLEKGEEAKPEQARKKETRF